MAKPKLSKTQTRLFIVLGLLLAYVVYDLATAKPKTAAKDKTKKTATETAVTNTSATTQAAVVAVPSKTAPAVTFAAWKRDPFRKRIDINTRLNIGKVIESLVMPKMTHFNLSAISENGKKSFAIINDQIVGIGEQVNGYRVVEIQASKVILKKNDFTFTLELPVEDDNF
ncbi:general secretion pathway protein GspB [bacterium]|nr:general secretion pathway protein GspB [bacterium]